MPSCFVFLHIHIHNSYFFTFHKIFTDMETVTIIHKSVQCICHITINNSNTSKTSKKVMSSNNKLSYTPNKIL